MKNKEVCHFFTFCSAAFSIGKRIFLLILSKNQNNFTPTRCRDLHLKQFCLEDIAPAILIILIAHIVLAVRWMLIKILSAVIRRWGKKKVIIVVGLDVV